jgi:hypothetical protein
MQLVEQLGDRRESGREAILDGLVGEGDREVSLAATRSSEQDRGSPFGDEFGAEETPESHAPNRRLEGEVELLDRLQERKARLAGRAMDASLATMRELFADEPREEVAIRPAFLLGLRLQLLSMAASNRVIPAVCRASGSS